MGVGQPGGSSSLVRVLQYESYGFVPEPTGGTVGGGVLLGGGETTGDDGPLDPCIMIPIPGRRSTGSTEYRQ